jgi:hypothetical protein
LNRLAAARYLLLKEATIMQTRQTIDTLQAPATETTLLEMVSTVSDLAGNDAETVQVIRHMLMSGNFWSENFAADFDFD